MQERNLLAETLQHFFGGLEAAGIRYAVMRSYEGFPHRNLGHDVDILIDPGSYDEAYRVLQSLDVSCDLRIVQIIRRQYYTSFRMARLSDGDLFGLQIDLQRSVALRGSPFMDIDKMLERRQRYQDFYILHPVDEALQSWLMVFLPVGRLKEAYYPKMLEATAGYPTEFQQALERIVGRRFAQQVFPLVRDARWDDLRQHYRVMRRAAFIRGVKRDPRLATREITHMFAMELRLRARLPGMFVGLLGSDEDLVAQVAGPASRALFRVFLTADERFYRWNPGVLIAPLESVHERANPWLLAGDYIVGYWVRIRLRKRRNGLVFFSNYLYDFTGELATQPLGPLARLLPRPDVIISFDGPETVAKLSKRVQRRVHIVSPLSSPDALADEVVRLTLEASAARHTQWPLMWAN